MFDTLTGILAPHTCIGCGLNGTVLCDDCIELYSEPLQPRCAGCKKLSHDFRVCRSCRSWLPLTSIYVSQNYEGVAEQLVKSLKFSSQRSAATPIAHILADITPNHSFDFVLCPIPTAPARIRSRGFDHALLITKEFSKRTNTPVCRALQRHTNNRQLGSSRSERMKQMSKEFFISNASQIEGRHILLVDDVFTTGATLSAAARVLREAGAKSVSAIVFAQKV